MGKAEVGTPKYIANKIKSKGLQKLRWYCEMCQKQCRDENGFKCHTMSESHQRQLLIVAENPNQFIDSFSKKFEDDFLHLLKTSYGTKRVLANTVYQDFIHDRNHTHMNATEWETLTNFVKHLGRSGKCVVDETEKGWYVTYVDQDPETITRQEMLAKKKKLEKDDEEKEAEFIKQQIERGKKSSGEVALPQSTNLIRESDESIKINLNIPKPGSSKAEFTAKLKESKIFKPPMEKKTKEPKKRKLTALEEIMEEELKKKKEAEEIRERDRQKALSHYKYQVDKMQRSERSWLAKDIVVKVVTKSLGDKYYKKKGYVKEIFDDYTALIVLLDTGTKLKLDQSHLETVVPAEGRSLLILSGNYRGCEAVLEDIDEKNFCVTIKIISGSYKNKRLYDVQYEDISKLYVSK